MSLGLALVRTLGANRLCATQCQVAHCARAWLATAELRYRSGELGVKRDLDTSCGSHMRSVPGDWYTFSPNARRWPYPRRAPRERSTASSPRGAWLNSQIHRQG